MVNIAQRMRRLTTLLAIRLGPGAAILPKNVQRIHLDFGLKIDGGNRGPKKFWRYMLPRLQYHNPSVPMSVARTADPTGPSTLSIFLSDSKPSNSSSAASAQSPPQTQETSETAPEEPSEVSEDLSAETTKGPLLASAAEVLTIDMKNKSEEEILSEFLEATGAKVVNPTTQELAELRDIEEQKERSAKDSERSKKVRMQWKKEQAMLAAARGDTV